MLGRFKNWTNRARKAARGVYTKFIKDAPEPPMSFALRPHQQTALDQLQAAGKGVVIMPTGAGKTIVGIMDITRRLEAAVTPLTMVVVAPRILLSQQLCSEYMEVINDRVANVRVLEVHSGSRTSTTKVREIMNHTGLCQRGGLHQIIFTTYHSLPRVAEAGVEVDTVVMDEAHNSVQRSFYPAVKYFAQTASRAFFYTATPKYSATANKPGMNDATVFGNTIINVPAPEMVKGGFIVPPKVVARQLDTVAKEDMIPQRDADHILGSIDEHKTGKVLVAAKAVRQIIRLFSDSNFAQELKKRGYSYMHISASHGAIIDGKQVTRDEFFSTLNAWGKINGKKFVVLHHSILSEGINVSGLEAVIFMRGMDAIGFSQTIGRVIRLHKDDAAGLRNGTIQPGAVDSYTKSFGLCIVPVFNKTQAKTAKQLQTVVNTIFVEGQPAVSTVRR